MRFTVKVLTALILLVNCNNALAQFSIRNINAEKLDTRELADSVFLRIDPHTNLRNDFMIEAQRRAMRKELRKERNLLEFDAGMQLTQTQFQNWASGGDNTFSGRATVYMRHQYQRNKLGFDTKTEARYGLNRIEKKNFKNEDEFKINFLTTWNMHRYWSYATSVNLRSQFSTSYKSRTDKTRISTFMAPGYLDLAVGFTYIRDPWNIVLSPVGGSAVFMLDDKLAQEGKYGLDPGMRSKWKVGPSVRVNYDKTFYKDIFRLRTEIYSFTNLKSPPTARWETTFDIKPTSFLSTTFYALAYYDKESETPKPDKVQFKYSIGVGLTYNFKNRK